MAETETPAADAAPETEAPTPRPRLPFSLRRGVKLRMGYRRGTVKELRGGGAQPYDVQIVWDGDKYPHWYLYATLAADYEAGTLEFV